MIILLKPSGGWATLWKKSLKCRFFFALALPVLAVLALAGIAGYFSAHHEVDEIYDAQLSNTAKTIMALMEHEAAKDDAEIQALEARFKNTGHHYEKYTAIRLWKNDKLIFYTNTARNFGPQHVIAGFSNKEIDDASWRFFVLPDPELNFTVEVAEKYWVRRDLINKILLTMFIPFLLLVPLLLPLFWLGLRYGLKPLVQISNYVSKRSSLDLSPISVDKTPTEILPLTREINALMARVDHALQVERRFTDLAAHELRTPLAVIKTQVQNVSLAHGEEERKELLNDLKDGVDRASNMVGQLLALARLGEENIVIASVSLNEAIKEVAQELSPLALSKQISVSYESTAEITLMTNQEILYVALRNLLTNAIKYTPINGTIHISIDKGILSISDSGPGIPEDKLALVTDRFYRVPGNRETGSGLGLAIVSRAAEILEAKLILTNQPQGGLKATLSWQD